MRVFVSGASGWIGTPTVAELVGAGHQVVGLARSDTSAAKVEAAGGTALRGDLTSVDTLAAAAREADAVVHLAFDHALAFGAGDFAAAAEMERTVIEAIGETLVGSDAAFLIASGTGVISPGRVVTENDGHEPNPQLEGGLKIRWESAEWTLGLASRGVRSIVMRLAPTNHGEGDTGFMKQVVETARTKGVSAYVGDGTNRWPAGAPRDTAALIRLAIEKAPAGSTLHAVAEEGVELGAVAAAIGRHLDLPTESIPADQAIGHFGFVGGMLALDIPASSTLTRELTGWQPTRPGLLEDLDADFYYREVVES
jgi:nucleoside-diphosphate-sugar epimerase